MTAKATHVTYFATPYGYSVAAYDKFGQPVEEYSAGNSRACSQTYINPDAPGAVSEKQLRIWAEAQAYDMAETHGLERSVVHYDTDGEQDAIDQHTELCETE